MGSLKGRLNRLDKAIQDPRDEEYRGICFCYNLIYASDADLEELKWALIENRPIDPLFYRPIPSDAPKSLVEDARRAHYRSQHLTPEDIKEIEADVAELAEKRTGVETPLPSPNEGDTSDESQ